jgi:hypothetical protein
MNRMCKKAEPTVKIGNRPVIADNMKFQGSASIHDRCLCKVNSVISYLVSVSIRVRGGTFRRTAPSLAELSEYMISANTTDSTVCIAVEFSAEPFLVEINGRELTEDSGRRRGRCDNKTSVASAAAKSRNIKCRGLARKGRRLSYANEKGVS